MSCLGGTCQRTCRYETGRYCIYKDRSNLTCPVMAEPVKFDGSDMCPVLAEDHVGERLAGILYIRIEGI